MFQNIKKYLISSATIIVFVTYVVYQRVNDAKFSQNAIQNFPNENNATNIVPNLNVSTEPEASIPAGGTNPNPPSADIKTQIKSFAKQFDDDDDDDDDDDNKIFVPKPTQTPTKTVVPTKPVTTPVTTKPAATTPVAQTAGIFKDGTYTGSSVFARDGYLQTQAIIQGGKLVDVKFPVLPNGSDYSTTISAAVLPILRTEAIQAQSANVNAVSQATLTSASFNESLGVALASAKK